MDQFLGVACRLKIEGLLGNEDGTAEVKDGNIQNQDNLMVSNSEYLEDVNEAKSVRNTKVAMDEKIIVPTSVSAQDIDQISAEISKHIERLLDGTYKCALCGKTSNQNSHIRTHIETHMEGLQFPCQICGKTFRSRQVLYNHKLAKHKI